MSKLRAVSRDTMTSAVIKMFGLEVDSPDWCETIAEASRVTASPVFVPTLQPYAWRIAVGHSLTQAYSPSNTLPADLMMAAGTPFVVMCSMSVARDNLYVAWAGEHAELDEFARFGRALGMFNTFDITDDVSMRVTALRLSSCVERTHR